MKPKALFVHATDAPDLREDLAMLRDAYTVESFFFDARQARSALGLARLMRKQAAWLRREIPGAAFVYGCFADYHLVLPALVASRAGVPLAVRLGGYDANHLPELGYGVYDSRWRAPLARLVLRRAALLLPVTEALIAGTTRYATWPEPRANGVRTHVPGLATPHITIATGYAPADWPVGPRERSPVVVTVAYLDDDRTALVKGLDVLLAAALHLAERVPQVRVRVVGVTPEFAATLQARGVPACVDLVPPLPREALAKEYAAASVYAHPARTEGGLPNVLAEAMLCGCVPIVSEAGMMPTTIGPVGEAVASPEPTQWAEALVRGLAQAETQREAARAHIATTYPLAARAERLLEALSTLTSSAGTQHATNQGAR